MPVGTIITQPEPNAIRAAYRPVIIEATATKTDNTSRPPVVYCDIYFNTTYYKTISKTQYSLIDVAYSTWRFDIQDAAQEYLRKFVGANGESSIVQATPVITACFCRLRSSGHDANGFVQAEGTAPIQGTEETDPVPGTGFQTNTFYIINATLQHEDTQDISSHLDFFKKRTWASNTWPLSHRPDYYKLCVDDSDIFPILHNGNAISCLRLKYQLVGQSSWIQVSTCELNACPLPTSFTISVINNGDGTQTFTFNWGSISSPTAQLDIQYRESGSTAEWTSNIGSVIPTRSISLPLGLYNFRVAGVGDCSSIPSNEYKSYGIIDCVAPVIRSAIVDMPNAQVGIPYSFSLGLGGTQPFTLANVVKPSWMTITVSGIYINFSGMPDAIGDDVPVSFDITNCGGEGVLNYSDTIDVISAAGSTITNNSEETFVYKVRINEVYVASGTINPGQTINFTAPELDISEGYDLFVYTQTYLMTSCTAVSNSVNIPMEVDTSGVGTNNQARNTTYFAITNGVQITIT